MTVEPDGTVQCTRTRAASVLTSVHLLVRLACSGSGGAGLGGVAAGDGGGDGSTVYLLKLTALWIAAAITSIGTCTGYIGRSKDNPLHLSGMNFCAYCSRLMALSSCSSLLTTRRSSACSC